MQKQKCCLLCLALASAVTASFAAGTPAGTSITNRIYVDYKDTNGNAMTRVFSNTIATIVSQVAGLEFVPATQETSAGKATNSDTLLPMIQYAGMQVMLEALRQAGDNLSREGIRDAFYKVQNFKTILGPVSVQPDGETGGRSSQAIAAISFRLAASS